MFAIKTAASRRLCGALVLLMLLASLVPAASAQTAEKSKTDELNMLFTTADLMDATVAELLAAMEDERLTSVELTQMYLDRIEAYDDALGLNSILALNPNALEEAAQADAARAAGEPLGRLHGIPVLVKDNIDVAGMATTAGSLTRVNAIAWDDAEVVARLRAEGAVILGKTNMAEFAQSGNNSRSGVGGVTHNAYDLSRTPAGSSGGTAVAITCNFAAVGLGTDTGSSIRRPASFANIYGLRPSYGIVSRDGLYFLDANRDMIGPMCRTPEDLALMMDILAGSDAKDSRTANAEQYLPENGYTAFLNADGLEGKRIGYLANSLGYYYGAADQLLKYPTPLDDRIVGMTENLRETLVAGGAVLVDLIDLLPESAINSYTYMDSWSGQLLFRETVTELLAEHRIDAVLYVSQTDVPQIEQVSDNGKDNAAVYIKKFGSFAGLPEIVLPMGFSDSDPENGFDYPLPLGANLFAGYGQDAVLIEIAYAYSQTAQVRQQPWTTPALPDAALGAFALGLLAEVEALQLSDYTGESGSALLTAAEHLQGLYMEGAEGDAGVAVPVAEYQAAALALARAYDALEAAPPVPEPTEALPLPTVGTAGTSEKEPEQSVPLTAIVIPGALFAAAAVAAAVWRYRKKRIKLQR